MKARFCTQCQVSFRPKNRRTLSILWLFDVIEGQNPEKGRNLYMDVFLIEKHPWFHCWTLLSTNIDHSGHPRRHKEDQNKISKKKMHETLSYSPFGCHFNRERVPGIVVLPLFFVLEFFLKQPFHLNFTTWKLANWQHWQHWQHWPPVSPRGYQTREICPFLLSFESIFFVGDL